MDFDQTQVLDLDDYLEDTEEEEDGISRLPVGYLKVLKFRGFPETSFPVYEGDNLIGRDDKCNITIPTKPVSKQHACIEIRDGTHLIYDCNSRNRTKRNKVFLKPRVRYELQNEDQLIFADVKCQYLLGTYKDEADDKNSDTGSETGSESMLPESSEDLELEKKSKIVTSSPKHEKGLDGSLENKVIEPTQDHRSKDSGIVSPVFCAETDSETDEEKDASKPGEEKEPGPTLLYSCQDNREAEKVDSSFVDDQTQQYSHEDTGDNNCNMEATLPATLVIEPDIIPTTPGVFAAVDEDKTSGVLKRAVEVRCDPFKRVSTGNTLDYGLETLETPNFSRESVDTSGDDNKRNEFSLVKSSENVNSDLVSVEKTKDDEMETVDNSKTLKETLRNEDVILDDLMATQSYEARNIPESPVSEDEAPFVKHDEDTMPEQYSLEATQAYAGGGNSLSGEASEDMATQAYGIFDEICASDEETDAKNATQAYGLYSDNFTLVEETGDGVATLAYEHVDSDSALLGDKGGGKVRQPAVVHAQQQGCMQDKELKKDNEELTLFDEFDGQSTQVYSTEVGSQSPGVNLISPVIKINVLDNGDQRKKQRSKVTFADPSDSESGACTKRDTKPVKTDESSDSAELPSLASLGISIGMEKEATDNEEDFALPARRSSRIRTPSKRHAAESTSSSARKSPSTVIEGENSLNSLKRCYVECTSENGTSQANKMAKVGSPEIGTNEKVNSRASRGRGKTRGRSRKSVATKRGKKGMGKRETDEMVGEELVELDKKEEFKDDNSKDQEKELVITTSGDKRSNSENTKSKLNELVGEEMKEEETGMKVQEIKKKNNKKNENKEMANENIDEKEYKGQGVTLNDEDNVKGSGKKCIGRGRKKSAIQQGVRFRKGKLQDSEEKITPEETGRVSEKDESTERLDMVISETKGAAMPDLDVGDVMDVDGPPGHEGIKQDEKDNRRPVSTKDTDTHDFDATTKESKYGRVKKAGKGKIKNGESNQEDVKNVELAGKRRNTGTRGRVRKEIKTEDKVSENERLEAGPKGRMVKREIAARVDAEYNIEVKERKDDKEESKKKGRTGGKKASKDKDSEEDIFKFDDHDSESTPKPCSTTKSKVLQLSSASSACGKRSSSRTGRQDKVNEEKLTQHESAEFSESFLAPEMPVSSSQRSRRSSTSSEASSQGTPSRGRQRGKRSPAASSSVGSSPFKKTKLDPEPSSNIRVLFTGLASEAQARKIVEDLRGEVVDSVYECTHLVTDKVRRTVKFLCALSRGIPVVDKRWLQASKKSKSFIDCSSFTVKDKATEKQYDFSLNRSLEMAQAKGLLEGYTIHVTPHVVPKPEYMKDIIKCAKGEFAPKMPTSFSDHVLVVSCDEDKNLCQNAVGHVHTSELLLTGILRQQLDLEQYPCHFVRNVNV